MAKFGKAWTDKRGERRKWRYLSSTRRTMYWYDHGKWVRMGWDSQVKRRGRWVWQR